MVSPSDSVSRQNASGFACKCRVGIRVVGAWVTARSDVDARRRSVVLKPRDWAPKPASLVATKSTGAPSKSALRSSAGPNNAFLQLALVKQLPDVFGYMLE